MVVVVTVAGLAAGGVLGGTRQESPVAHACPTGNACLYVLNRSGIVPIGLRRGRIGPPIHPLSNPYGTRFGYLFLHTLAVTPAGRTAYVGAEGVTPVNLDTGVFGPRLPLKVPPDDSEMFLLGPTGQFLYLELSTGHDKTSSLREYSFKSRKIVRSIALPKYSYIQAISPTGKSVYASTDGGADLVAINLVSDSVGPPISVPMGVDHVAITASGVMAYATGNSNVEGYSFITPIDLSTGMAEAPIRLDHAPTSIVLASNGQIAYVTGNGSPGPPTRPAVMFVNLVTERVTKSIRLRTGAMEIAIAGQP